MDPLADAEHVRATRTEIDRGIAAGPFAPRWDSLASFQVPAWYQDGKFGIFIHWGVYAVPAFGNAGPGRPERYPARETAVGARGSPEDHPRTGGIGDAPGVTR